MDGRWTNQDVQICTMYHRRCRYTPRVFFILLPSSSYSFEAFRNLLLTSGSTCSEILFLRRLTTSCIRWTHLQCHLLRAHGVGRWWFLCKTGTSCGCWWLTLGADPEEPTVLVAIMIVVLIYGKVTTSSCSSSFGVKSLAPLFLKVRLFSKGSCSQPMDWTRGACPKGWDTNVPCAFWGLTARCGHRAPCQNARTHARID